MRGMERNHRARSSSGSVACSAVVGMGSDTQVLLTTDGGGDGAVASSSTSRIHGGCVGGTNCGTSATSSGGASAAATGGCGRECGDFAEFAASAAAVASAASSVTIGNAVADGENSLFRGNERTTKAKETPSSSAAVLPPKESSVKVLARFRPPCRHERDSEDCTRAFFVWPDRRTIETLDRSQQYEFDCAFGEDSSQVAVYDAAGRPMVEDVLEGYNGTVLAYGQTGSGKSYTMFGQVLGHGPLASCFPAPVGVGTDFVALADESHGIIHRAAQHVFERINGGPSDVEFLLRCSLFEVYREQLRDLLEPSNCNLRVKETPQQGVYVDGLAHEFVTCEGDIVNLLRQGSRMRTVAATRLNQHSSRSHVIFSIVCEQRGADGTGKVGKLHFVDLAGSEKVWKSSSSGVTLEEGKKINWSLSALGNVICALSEKRPHVPFRDSKLTRILQETLGGNFKMSLMVACSPMQLHFDETISTLHFAARAKTICNHVRVNFVHSTEQLLAFVSRLKHELLLTRREIATRKGERCSLMVPPLPGLSEDTSSGGKAHSLNWNATMLDIGLSPNSDGETADEGWGSEADDEEGDYASSPNGDKPESRATQDEVLKRTKASLDAAKSEMAETAADILELRRSLKGQDNAAMMEIEAWKFPLRSQILRQEMRAWQLRSEAAVNECRKVHCEQQLELTKTHCQRLRHLIEQANVEEKASNEPCSVFQSCSGSSAAVASSSAGHQVIQKPPLVPMSESTTVGSSLSLPSPSSSSSMQPRLGPPAAKVVAPAATAGSLAENSSSVPAANTLEHRVALGSWSPQHDEEVWETTAGKTSSPCGESLEAALEARLRHSLQMLQVDFDREEDMQQRRVSRQDEDFQQWLITAKHRMDVLDSSQSESMSEEMRLQELLRGRVAELAAARDRARAACLWADLAADRERRLELAGSLRAVASDNDVACDSRVADAVAAKTVVQEVCREVPTWMRDSCDQMGYAAEVLSAVSRSTTSRDGVGGC
eukprot:TRINITY_DN21811_c0_g1_i1.p1 TRINITY_DN21811_c0_g1~~TRINITY_DN21811_c0_g1_i1.p1  ORF type:complete len:1001 (-),score=182.36 TRINITY_DN21811_c0_g1_i1:195-3197(-)